MVNGRAILIVMTVVVSVAVSLPVHKERRKRDVSVTHQIVQVPEPHHESAKVVEVMVSKTKPSSKRHDESSTKRRRPSAERKGVKKAKKSNTELLHHLGMTKLRSPPINHHRKRLASQSRKTHSQKTTTDSKMFVIKLPPHPYYYAHHDLELPTDSGKSKSVNNLPVDFKSNGKPSRVYHWNIPVLKKMVARKAGSSGKSAILADSDIFSIDKQSTWNETDDDKSIYRKATYYGPRKPSKHTFRKFYSNNGRPHSFYVIGKSKTPASIHRLLP